MRILSQILFAAVIASGMGLAGSAHAQTKVIATDGIAASPKVRQMLNERRASSAGLAAARDRSAASVTPRHHETGKGYAIAASPKVRQAFSEKAGSAGARSMEVAGTGYRPTGADGITASPKLRQQLDERSTLIMVAPVK